MPGIPPAGVQRFMWHYRPLRLCPHKPSPWQVGIYSIPPNHGIMYVIMYYCTIVFLTYKLIFLIKERMCGISDHQPDHAGSLCCATYYNGQILMWYVTMETSLDRPKHCCIHKYMYMYVIKAHSSVVDFTQYINSICLI